MKLAYDLKLGTHQMHAGIGWKHEKVRENSSEWEYRDSSGYSVPHTGNDLQVIYNMRAKNSINSNQLELYAQDTWRKESSLGILSFNYGLRLSYWSWNKEWLISPRASLGFVPASNDNFTFRLALGLYNQRPFYKELRDTITIAGNTTVQLNQNIKSQRSFQVVGGMEYKFKIANRPFKFTTEAYYTPADVCIQGSGITPDHIVELPEDLTYYSITSIPYESDTQLQAAVEYLRGLDR